MVNNAELSGVFAALADPTRLKIIERLSKGPLTVGQIAEGFAISQPAISRHVRILEESGLLQRNVVGRVHRCTLSPVAMDSAAKWIEKQRAYWNKALDRLESVLANTSSKRK